MVAAGSTGRCPCFNAEYAGLKALGSGQIQVVLVADYDTRDQAFKMLEAAGLLLQVKVSEVTGKIK